MLLGLVIIRLLQTLDRYVTWNLTGLGVIRKVHPLEGTGATWTRAIGPQIGWAGRSAS